MPCHCSSAVLGKSCLLCGKETALVPPPERHGANVALFSTTAWLCPLEEHRGEGNVAMNPWYTVELAVCPGRILSLEPKGGETRVVMQGNPNGTKPCDGSNIRGVPAPGPLPSFMQYSEGSWTAEICVTKRQCRGRARAGSSFGTFIPLSRQHWCTQAKLHACSNVRPIACWPSCHLL